MSKKVAFICVSLTGGGAERVIQTLANYFVSQDFQVKVICLERSTSAYEFDDRVSIVQLKSSLISQSFMKSLVLPFQAFELNFLLNKIADYNVVSFLVRPNLASIMCNIFFSKNIIISERNFSKLQYADRSLKSRFLNGMISLLYPRAKKIIAISEGVRRSLIDDYGVQSQIISTIYNPQNIDEIRQLGSVMPKEFIRKSFKYITLGRLVEQKDHVSLIKAFYNVCSEFPNSELFILGEGPLRSELYKLVCKLKLDGKVHIIGFRDNAFQYLSNSDAFVFSSKFEGFGNVLVEAMASGLPVISTDCPSGPAEILGYGEYGLLCKVGDVETLSSHMKSIQRKDLNVYYSEKSLFRSEFFDVKRIAEEYKRVIFN